LNKLILVEFAFISLNVFAAGTKLLKSTKWDKWNNPFNIDTKKNDIEAALSSF